MFGLQPLLYELLFISWMSQLYAETLSFVSSGLKWRFTLFGGTELGKAFRHYQILLKHSVLSEIFLYTVGIFQRVYSGLAVTSLNKRAVSFSQVGFLLYGVKPDNFVRLDVELFF